MPLQNDVMINLARHFIFLLLAVTGFSINPSAYAETIEAQWEVHQIRFRYSGFSSHYTCDGIQSTLKRLLKLLGARDDVRVESPCTDHLRPQRFHRVLLAFAMPVPADKTDISREIIPAEWQEVRITGNLSRYLDAGDCELVEQFQRQVLPKLSARNIKKKLRCIPYRHQFNALNLKMITLKALEKTELEEEQNDSQPGNRQNKE